MSVVAKDPPTRQVSPSLPLVAMSEEINDDLSDDQQAVLSESEEVIAQELSRLATTDGSSSDSFDACLAPLLKADAPIDPELLLEYLSNNCALEVLGKCASSMIALLAGADSSLGERWRLSELLLRLVLLCPPFLKDSDLTAYEAVCDTESSLYFGFYKTVAAAANVTLTRGTGTTFKDRCAITYRSLGILARKMKEPQLSTSDQWAILEAINVTKDSCPHGDVFHDESAGALLAISSANRAAHDNIIAWNACKVARKGDMNALAAAQPDGSGGIISSASSSSSSRRPGLFSSHAKSSEPTRFPFFRSSSTLATPDKAQTAPPPTSIDSAAEVDPGSEPGPSRFPFFRSSSSLATSVKVVPVRLSTISDSKAEAGSGPEEEPEVQGSIDSSAPTTSPTISPTKAPENKTPTPEAAAVDSITKKTTSGGSASSPAPQLHTAKSSSLLSRLGFATTKTTSIEAAMSAANSPSPVASSSGSTSSSSSSSSSNSSSRSSDIPNGSRSPKKPSGEAEVLREYVSTLAAENKELKDALTAHILQMRAVQSDCTKKALEVRELQTKLEVVELEAQVGAEEVEQCKRQVLAMSSELNRFKTPAKGDSPAAGKTKAGGGGKSKKVARPASAPRLRPVASKTGPTAAGAGPAKALTLNRPEVSSSRPQRPRSASPALNRLSTGARGKSAVPNTLRPYLLPTRPLSGGSKRPTKPTNPKPSSATTRPTSARPKRAAEV